MLSKQQNPHCEPSPALLKSSVSQPRQTQGPKKDKDPPSYLTRVLQDLAFAGLVKSRGGPARLCAGKIDRRTHRRRRDQRGCIVGTNHIVPTGSDFPGRRLVTDLHSQTGYESSCIELGGSSPMAKTTAPERANEGVSRDRFVRTDEASLRDVHPCNMLRQTAPVRPTDAS